MWERFRGKSDGDHPHPVMARRPGRSLKHARYHWLLLPGDQSDAGMFGRMLGRTATVPSPAG